MIPLSLRVKRSLPLPLTMDKWLKIVKGNESKLNENDSSVTVTDAETVAMASCSSLNFDIRKLLKLLRKGNMMKVI